MIVKKDKREGLQLVNATEEIVHEYGFDDDPNIYPSDNLLYGDNGVDENTERGDSETLREEENKGQEPHKNKTKVPQSNNLLFENNRPDDDDFW